MIVGVSTFSQEEARFEKLMEKSHAPSAGICVQMRLTYDTPLYRDSNTANENVVLIFLPTPLLLLCSLDWNQANLG